MLTLTRRAGQTIRIGTDIELTVVSVSGGRVRIGVKAPRSLPVHRGELIERVIEENQRALAEVVAQGVAGGGEIVFPEGLVGLREHDSFVLCELNEGNPLRCLVSCRDPEVQLLVVDVEEVFPDYPTDFLRAEYEEETAVALIVRVPADGGEITANTAAPLVIGMDSRVGRQVLLERRGLRVDAPLNRARGAAEKTEGD